MLVEADVLSELWMEDVRVLMSLKLRTPRLRVLHIYKCSHEELRISAPRLEELAIVFQLACPPRWLEVDGDLPSVRSLKIRQWSHRSRFSDDLEAGNDTNMLLLKHCSSLTCLQVFLHGPKPKVRLPVSLLAYLKQNTLSMAGFRKKSMRNATVFYFPLILHLTSFVCYKSR